LESRVRSGQLNIAFLVNDIAYGGAAKSLFLLIKYLDKQRFQVRVYSTRISSEDFLQEYILQGASVHLISLPSLYSFGDSGPNTKAKFVKKLQARYSHNIDSFVGKLELDKIDLLHINTTVFSYLPPLLKKRTSIPIIMHVRELLECKISYTYRFMIESMLESDRIICITDNESSVFRERTEKVVVMANPVEIEGATSNQLLGRDICVGTLGTLKKDKRIDLFLRIVKEIYTISPGFLGKFIIVTGYSRRSYIKLFLKGILRQDFYPLYFQYLLDKLRLADKVEFLTNMPDIRSFYDRLSIYVRTAKPWGRDIIEVMNIGILIVACGSSGFFVKDGVTGYLVNDGEYKAAARRIVDLISNPIKADEFVTNAKKLIYDKCEVKSYVRKIEEIYDQLYRLKEPELENDR